MKKSVRPFSARIPFEDKTRLAIAQTLDRREELDLSWVSRHVLNRNHAYLFQYLFKRTPRTLDFADAIKLAHFLKIDAAIFSPDAPLGFKLSEPSQPTHTGIDGNNHVPIKGPARHQPTAIQANEISIGRAPRHPAQIAAKDAFAFYAPGEDMIPRYRPGELVYAVTGKLPAEGQDCVVEMSDGVGYLREFTRRTETDIICQRLNPAQEWVQPLTAVKTVHAVVGRG